MFTGCATRSVIVVLMALSFWGLFKRKIRKRKSSQARCHQQGRQPQIKEPKAQTTDSNHHHHTAYSYHYRRTAFQHPHFAVVQFRRISWLMPLSSHFPNNNRPLFQLPSSNSLPPNIRSFNVKSNSFASFKQNPWGFARSHSHLKIWFIHLTWNSLVMNISLFPIITGNVHGKMEL